MGRRYEQVIPREEYATTLHKRMLKLTSNQGNYNSNNNEMPFPSHLIGKRVKVWQYLGKCGEVGTMMQGWWECRWVI